MGMRLALLPFFFSFLSAPSQSLNMDVNPFHSFLFFPTLFHSLSLLSMSWYQQFYLSRTSLHSFPVLLTQFHSFSFLPTLIHFFPLLRPTNYICHSFPLCLIPLYSTPTIYRQKEEGLRVNMDTWWVTTHDWGGHLVDNVVPVYL